MRVVIALCVSDEGYLRTAKAEGGNGRAGGGKRRRGGANGGDPSGTPTIYSASLDNTIRAYDPYDMATLSTLHEEQ